MKRKLAAIGFAVVLGAGACTDTTEPPEVIELRIAHVAPGAGAYAVGMDGNVLIPAINPLQYTYVSVGSEPHVYAFENTAAELSVDVPVADITAVLLADAAEPEVRAYQLARTQDTQLVQVVHADSAASDLVVLMEVGDSTVTTTIQPGLAEEITLDPGDYAIRVHPAGADEAEAETLEAFTIRSGDHGFIIIYPSAEEDERYARFLL